VASLHLGEGRGEAAHDLGALVEQQLVSRIRGERKFAGIDELRDQVLASHPNFRVYAKDSGEHVWLLFEPDKISPRKDGSGKHLADWISEMLDPSATWDSVTP